MCRKTKKGFIIEEIEKSGYPLELYISGILKDQEWSIFPNQYYYDKDSGKGREFDIRAEKEYLLNELDSVLTIRLLIECKKIPGNAWTFFEGPHLHGGSIASFPTMVTILDSFDINSNDAMEKIWVPLLDESLHYDKGFFASGYKEIVLDRKQSKKSDISNIWDSEITLIKTIPSERQDCLSEEIMVSLVDDFKTDGFDSWHSSKAPQCIYVLFPLIVFQGDIYSTSFPLSEKNLKETDYICLNRDYKSANYKFSGTIDILKKDYFKHYLIELERDFQKIMQSTITNWEAFIDKEKDLLYLNNQR